MVTRVSLGKSNYSTTDMDIKRSKINGTINNTINGGIPSPKSLTDSLEFTKMFVEESLFCEIETKNFYKWLLDNDIDCKIKIEQRIPEPISDQDDSSIYKTLEYLSLMSTIVEFEIFIDFEKNEDAVLFKVIWKGDYTEMAPHEADSI